MKPSSVTRWSCLQAEPNLDSHDTKNQTLLWVNRQPLPFYTFNQSINQHISKVPGRILRCLKSVWGEKECSINTLFLSLSCFFFPGICTLLDCFFYWILFIFTPNICAKHISTFYLLCLKDGSCVKVIPSLLIVCAAAWRGGISTMLFKMKVDRVCEGGLFRVPRL